MNLIYICNGDVSVFEAQVLELLRFLQKQDIKVSLLLGYKTIAEKESYQRKLRPYSELNVYWKRSYPMYPFYERKSIQALYEGIIQIPNWQTSIIHIRSGYSGYTLKKIAQTHGWSNRIIIDIRAVVKEELMYKIKAASLKRKLMDIIQIIYYNRVYKELFCPNKTCNIVYSSVSPLINEYIKQHYPSNPYPLYFNPNIAGTQFVFNLEQRVKLRKEMEVADNELLVLCSSNGASLWQKDFMIINRLTEIGLHVLNLSKKDYGIKSCVTKTVPFSEMPGLLSAADVAVLWRDDVIMNQLASPSKFSEFAAMGLFVIHNSSVNVATNYIQNTGNGLLVQQPEEITVASFDKDHIFNNRTARIEQGLKSFGIDEIACSYINLYTKVFDTNNKS